MKNLADKPFALVGVNGNNKEPKKLKDVMDREKMNWRSFAADPAIAERWNEPGTPTYYVLDHKGVIRHKWVGYPGAKSLDAALEALIKEVEANR